MKSGAEVKSKEIGTNGTSEKREKFLALIKFLLLLIINTRMNKYSEGFCPGDVFKLQEMLQVVYFSL